MEVARNRWKVNWTVAAAVLAVAVLVSGSGLSAQVLDDENRLDVVLSDGTSVVLYGETGRTPGVRTNEYHYLPVNLRLSTTPDGTPEFLFVKYVTEERVEEGGVAGGLVHFLMEWGLTLEQETELRTKLEDEYNGAELMGAVKLLPEDESGSFQIVSATMSDQEMTPSLVTSGKAPLIPGGKVASAARLNEHGAQLLATTLDETASIADVSIVLNFNYSTQCPAARGRIIYDWSKYEEHYDSLEANYERKVSGRRKTKFLGITLWSSPTYQYSYDEMREQYDFLRENEIVTIEFDEFVADERVAAIREAFFQYFLNQFSEPVRDEVPPPVSDQEKEKTPNIRYGTKYTYKQTFLQRSFKKKRQVVELNYRMAIKWPFQLVGNLASWYDGVRDNERCVASVNLNDPFYQHRDIRFILDLDAEDMFGDIVNYVTVNVKKKRNPPDRNYENHLTFNRDTVASGGISQALTYARGSDTNADVYEYKSQWSLRGGRRWPENPAWAKGEWEGVTLAAPVKPRTIEVEATLQDLIDNNITRVTAQIHYEQFGEELEDNIHVSPARGEPLVAKKIYIDKNMRGYVYRLIFNHTDEGKLVTPWSALIADDYIYASIPDNLLDTTSPVFSGAKAAAETLIDSATDRVLDEFRAILTGGN